MDIVYSPAQVFEGVWTLAILAFFVSLVLSPFVRWIAYRKGIVDRPDALLKPHERPIAYLGGLAVCGGFLTAMIVRYSQRPGLWPLVVPVLIGVVIITVTGLLDDLRDLKPRHKVLGQLLAAGVLLVGLASRDIHISAAHMVLSPIGFSDVPVWVSWIVSGAMTAVIVVAACNAVNLLDGLDGLCGGVTGIIAIGFMALTAYLACWGHFADEGTDKMRVVICLCMAGAVLGFLPYNIPPASIFLGDAGSMLLGFFVATMMMLFAREGHARWILAACVIFGLPIVDTGLAVVRRALSGKSLFAGDRSHLYDQLVDRGMSVRKVVGLFYLLAVLAAVVGVLQAIFLRIRYAIVLDGIIVVVIAAVFLWKRMILPSPRAPKS